jgi:hypothetical protein
MAKKISKSKTPAGKSTMVKIAEKVGELAGKIVNQKEHFVEMAGDAIDSVKEKVKGITGKKRAVKNAVKRVAKKAVKKIEKKVINPAAKKISKSAPAKKVTDTKKTVKAVVKKATKKAIKKVASKKK